MFNLTKNQESFNKQVPKNLLANIIFFLLNVLIGLFLVPYFIKTLGVASYGIIPLATSITSYVGLISQSLNTSVSRYLTIDLQKKDYEKANITFNTALFGTLVIISLTIPIILAISYYSLAFFDIPSSQKNDVLLLFIGVMSAFLIRAWGSNFGIFLFAYNRLDLQNIINSISIIIQSALIILLFVICSPKLVYIGLAYLISSIITILMNITFSKKVYPFLKININDFNKSQWKNMFGTGSWMVIDQIGTLLLFQIDLIIVNKLFGSAAGGEYAVVLIWNNLIRAVSGILAGVFAPIILTYYANKKFEEIIILSKSTVKLMGLAMALPVGIICGFSSLLLTLWVGPQFSKLSPLMWLLIGHLAINMSTLTLFSINVSFNKVRIPALITILAGVCNVLLALLLTSITEWGYYGVAVAGFVVLTARHLFFVPMYATRILGISKNPYKSPLIQVILSTITVGGISNLAYNWLNVSTPLMLILFCGMICPIYITIVWLIFLNYSERKFIESLIPQKIKNRLKFTVVS